RRVHWAALSSTDRLFDAVVTLQLDAALPSGARVTVTHAGDVVPGVGQWTARRDPDAISAAIHVSQVGYQAGWPKRVAISAYLGTMGEWPGDGVSSFVVERADGAVAASGTLTRRPEVGLPGLPTPYQHVLQADFSEVNAPGLYRMRVPGLGVSAPFAIGDAVAADAARAYALGILHQRCGAANALPFTRFVHDACHVIPAAIPLPGHASSVDHRLNDSTVSASSNPRHTAPRLRSLADALYPAVRTGVIDVRGGHHDAGDYGKYVINSAQFVNTLLFAADAFRGAADLDNLGLPESGDGVSDLVQLSLWEIDFLLRMQDDDGGWFFLVQPRDRSYESNVLPDAGDPQVVFPKNTSATAAAVAALAQAASTPAFRQASPVTARRALAAAERGWAFLHRAWAAHGRQGAYQMVTAYGDVFEDRDEIVWAATELYLATGDADAHRIVLAEFDPLLPSTWRWNWWQLFESYGAAARSYAFAPLTGRSVGRTLDATHLARCRQSIRAWADKVLADSDASAFGTSYPDESKRGRVVG
ncbi:MAG: glycoside hydrolase family 9 protein, partial [Acidobacteriota bacterium]